MKSKSSQGLSFSTIVLAVISIFILVLVILFVQGGLTGIRRPIKDISPDTISNARNVCTAFCNEAQATVRTAEDFQNSRYCTKTFAIDRGNGLGEFTGPNGQINDKRGDANPGFRALDDYVQCKNDDKDIAGKQPLWFDVLGPCTVQLTDSATSTTERDCPWI